MVALPESERPRQAMGGHSIVFAVALSACLVVPDAASAGQNPSVGAAVLRLQPPSATLGTGFSEIASVTELADGRIVIADRRERIIVAADFSSGAVTRMGREGRGPAEYVNVGPILPLGGDASLMADPQAGRWLVFSGAAIDRVVPSHDPAYRTTRGLVSGADTLGFLVARRAAPITEPRPATDSIVLLRVAATTGAADSIAALAGGATRVNAEFAGGTRPQRIRFTWPVLVVDEQEVLFPDGWLAIARLRPYRVDWRAPDGRWIRGAPLPFAEIALNDREKRAWRNREVTLGRREPPGDAEWATHLPPFLPSLPSAALIPAPDGTLLIARTPTADRPESRYDVVDRRARLIAQLVLRPNERLVSIGARAAYVVATSDDGLEFVRRHPWPPVDQAQQRR